MRNSDQSNTSQRRGNKNRKPNNRNGQRGGNSQKASNGHRNSQGSGNGQRNTSSRGRSRNELSQAWASDTTTLSSHMPTSKKNEWGKKKSDSKNGNGPRGRNKPSNGKNRSEKSNRNPNRHKPHSRTHNEAAAQKKDTASRGSGKQVGNIDPFELFCAYHLGITKDKGYRTANINEVANRFRSEPGMIKQALKEYDMDPESLLDRDFDMALAQLDIQVAPEGVDRLALAQDIYQDFKDAPRIKRDWNKILEEDRKENQKIFRD